VIDRQMISRAQFYGMATWHGSDATSEMMMMLVMNNERKQ
jgi:hypothetical protein